MKLLVLDGNSILNRAFYGIKLLTTKDGRYTNAIVGFLNILLKLEEMTEPDAVAIAFDVHAPTFRHTLYAGYKAGRKGMPEELRGQMPVLKELLTLLGYRLVEREGWEADDILGSLGRCCKEKGDECFIATGDRDSLQLIGDGVTVLLAATKMGRPVTTAYTKEMILEEYGVTPAELIEVKALMGDASDQIPGVAGIGQKTAGALIHDYHSIDYIYEHLEELPIKPGVREKLRKDRENAYLSRTLGTIRLDAPVDCEIGSYVRLAPKNQEAVSLLASLEMFKMIEKLGLHGELPPPVAEEKRRVFALREVTEPAALLQACKAQEKLCFLVIWNGGEPADLYVAVEDSVFLLHSETEGFRSFLEEMLALPCEKCTCDSKPFFVWARLHGIALELSMDLSLAGYLLNPSASSYEPLRLAQEYGVPLPEVENPLGGIAEEAQAAAVLPALWAKLSGLLAENGQVSLLSEIELPLARVLARMETEGVAVNTEGIEEFSGVISLRIDELVKEIYDQVGYEFNLNSPKQLGEALFEKLMLPAKKKTKTGYSTNAEVLESLRYAHPVVEMVLEYRTLSKLKSTYCDGLLKVVGEDGRIHSNFNQTETRTGRISSTEPNLQNIPVRQELGRELRRFFLAKDGCVLVDADYSQIELRVLADLADDRAMIDAFNHGDDIHTITASQVFHMPLEMVTPLMRSRAKAVNFGIVYGIGAFSLSKDIGVTRKEAEAYIEGYFAHYPGVKRYMDEMIDRAKAKGYAETLFGRRRYLPELAASNANLRAFGERVARNMPIQGTAADIIKIAMVKVEERLRKEQMKARLILQVHDELIVEAPVKEASAAAEILKEEMEAACSMKVKLLADVHIGKTWYDAKG